NNETDREVEFFDGSVIKCHANHEWTLYDRGLRRSRTVETKQLEKVKLLSGVKKPRARFQLPIRRCLELPEREQLIDPYFLGYWLGDGKSSDITLFHCPEDVEGIQKISETYNISARWQHQDTGVWSVNFAYQGIRKSLGLYDLLNNKHIPENYLLASRKQRLELLAGLVDSDGSADPKGRIRFSNANKTLIDNVYELVMSLGFRAYITEAEPCESTSGIQGKQTVYQVGFNPDIDIPTALPRKKCLHLNFAKRVIGLKEIRKVKPELGRCIQVDSEDGLYLVGRNLTTTHNSEIVSRRLPAYYLGKNPDKKIIATSYSADLAVAMSRDTQRIIDSQEYHEVFPETTLNSVNTKTTSRRNYKRTADEFEIVSHDGTYKCAGVCGGITGAGADLALIDDPLKDWKEALSPQIKQSIMDWYESTLYTRLSPNGKIIIVLTRWADDDLAGRLLKLAEEDQDKDQWEVISLPALYSESHEYLHPKDNRKDGEVLWPEQFTEKRIKKIRSTLSSKVWESLFQQEPNPAGGNVFDIRWFNYFKEVPKFEYKVVSWDCSFKKTSDSDFIAGTVWGVCGVNRYLLWVVRKRASFPETIREMCILRSRFPDAMWTVVEDKANGPAVIDTLKNKVKGLTAYCPTDSKEARATAVSPIFESGNVWLPDPNFKQNRFIFPWIRTLLNTYLKEFKSFPGGKNDDMVDSTVQAMIKLGGVKTSGWLDELLKGSKTSESFTQQVIAHNAMEQRNNHIADMMGWDIEPSSLTHVEHHPIAPMEEPIDFTLP
ncbi:phage terminase large subunit, partial [Candidatus Pacearchaeota archaeon]|nr:phage terminase large subunit [Candidatus Pacearchaeota archaeon]